MEQIIFYLFEYGVYLLAFYILFMLLFKGKSDHNFNRFYLISSPLICLILPLVQNTIFIEQAEVFSVILNPIEIAANGTNAIITKGNQSLPLINIILGLYFLVTAVFITRFIYGLIKIKSYKTNGTVSKHKFFQLIESDEIIVPFSFFKNIYLPKGLYKNEEREVIIEHEMSHIIYGHSIEKLFLLINKVFFWWNPIAYKYFNELELTHEYQVDEKLCKSTSKKSYSQFLLTQINIQNQYSFVNNISSHIKNRIMMISSKNKSTPAVIKWGAYLTLFVSVLFLHACNIENEEPLIQDNYEAIESNDKPIFTLIEVADTLTVFDYDTKEESVEITRSQLKVYKTPDVMPIFGDCENISDVDARYECSNNNLLTFIYSNLIYPEEARKNGVQGMTVVQFVIDHNGGISFVEIKRSIGNSTDKAVMEVISKMRNSDTKWIPGRHDGKNVSTRFILPVKFKLEG